MHYLIAQEGRNKYFVINEKTGEKCSEKPLTKQQAIKQYYALEASGEGIGDSIKALFNLHKGVRLDYQPKIRKFLELHGQDIITRLRVGRSPVISLVKKFVNFISLGALEKMIKAKGYDDVFHLFIFIDLKAKNGSTTTIQIEKNEVINLISNPKEPKDTYWMEVDNFTNNLTLRKFLDDTEQRMGKERYFKYDPFNNNCQVYILNLIQSMENGQYLTQELNNFIYQDTAILQEQTSGIAQKLMRGATNLAALANTVVEGRALKKKPTKKQILKEKHSAYRSMKLSQYGYSKPTKGKKKGALQRWKNEKWENLNNKLHNNNFVECGTKYKNQPEDEPTVCRPSKRISKNTPKPLSSELSKSQIRKAINLKKQGKYIMWNDL